MALCKNLAEVEFAGLGWVEGFNNRRFVGPIGSIALAEFNAMYYERLKRPAKAAVRS